MIKRSPFLFILILLTQFLIAQTATIRTQHDVSTEGTPSGYYNYDSKTYNGGTGGFRISTSSFADGGTYVIKYKIDSGTKTQLATGTHSNTSMNISITDAQLPALTNGQKIIFYIVDDAFGGNTEVTCQADDNGYESISASAGDADYFYYDVTAPTVSEVTSATSDAAIKIIGDVLAIKVSFTEIVTVTGTPQIVLETGSSDELVDYSSNAGSGDLIFNYTVASGNASDDLDYVGTTSLATNGGSIQDAAGNDADLTLATPGQTNSLGENKTFIVDGIAPTISNVTASTIDGSYSDGETITIQVVFDQIVTVTSGTPTLALDMDGSNQNASYSNGTGSTTLNFTYTVADGDNASDLDYTNQSALSGNITDVPGNDAVLTLAAPGNPTSLGVNKSIILDTAEPTVSSVTSSKTDGSYMANESIGITVEFDEVVYVTSGTPQITLETGVSDAVVDYTSGTTTNSFNFTYTVSSGETTSDLDYKATNALTGSITDLAGNTATLTLATPGQVNSISDNQAIIIDTTPPTVSDVDASTNGNKKIDDIIPVAVEFDEVVYVTGTPVITLETGDSDKAVSYTSGTGDITQKLTFTYTVEEDHSSGDLDYVSTTALTGVIKDLAGNQATLTLASPGAGNSLGNNKALVIDGIRPTISNVTSGTSNGSYKEGDIIAITIAFDDNVTVSGTPQLTLETGDSDAVVDYSSGTGSGNLIFNYTVSAGETASDLDYVAANSLSLNGATLQDAFGNDVTLTLPTPGAGNSLGDNKNFIIDTTVPTVDYVTSTTANGTYNEGDGISVNIEFSEIVNVTGTPQLTLETGGSDAVVDYASGSGSTTLIFTYTISAGETATDLDYVATSSLALNGGTIKDGALNDATLTLASPGAANSLGNNTNLVVDTSAPTVSSVSSADNNGYYLEDDVIAIDITFSETVIVTGTPQLTLETGGSDAVVDYSSGTGTNVLTFSYTVATNHLSADLDYVNNSSLALNSGTIKDEVGNNAVLTLANPGDANSLGDNKALVVDAVIPTFSRVSIASNHINSADTVAIVGDIVTLTLVALEDIQSPTVTIAGQTASNTAGADATQWTATYTMTSNEASTAAISFTVDFTDLAGNTGTQVIALIDDIDGSGVSFDKDVPTLDIVSIVSDNANSSLAKVGDVITVSITASELIKSGKEPSVTIAGNAAAVSRDSDTEFTATYTMSSSDNAFDGSAITFSITGYEDFSNNVGADVSGTTNGSSVSFDMTAPTLTTVSIASTTSGFAHYAKENEDVVLTLVASEEIGSTAGSVSMAGATTGVTVAAGADATQWTATKTLASHTEGTVAISIDFSDLAGNSGTTVTSITTGNNVTYDKTAPTLTSVALASNNDVSDTLAIVGNTITLTFVADDNLQEPTPVSIAGASPTVIAGVDGQNWSATYDMTSSETEGDVSFSITYKDSAGNAGASAQTALVGDANGVTFDQTATDMSGVAVDLVVGSDSGDSDTDNLTNDDTPEFSITGLTATDSIYLVINNSDTTARDKAGGATLSLTSSALADGEKNIKVVSKDLAGNWSSASTSLTVTIDTTPWTISTVPILMNTDDSGFILGDEVTNVDQPNFIFAGLPSTLDSILLFKDGVLDGGLRMSQGSLDTLQASSSWADGIIAITYKVLDIAGNLSSSSAGLTMKIDTGPPVQPDAPNLTSGTDSGSDNSDDITNETSLQFAVGSLSNGDRLYIFANAVVQDSLDITGASETITVNGAVTADYTVTAKDLAGNESAISPALTVTVDTDAPDVSGVGIDLVDASDSGDSNSDDLTNDYTPEFSITNLASADDSLYLYVDDVLDKGIEITATTMSITADSLSDNTHQILIKVKDLAGNLSIASATTLSIVIDTTPPTPASAPDLIDASDSGISSLDDITNVALPTFVLTGLPTTLDSIILYYDGQQGAGGQFDSGIRMSQSSLDTLIMTTPLANATTPYLIYYAIRDIAGNVSLVSEALSVRIDTQQPILTPDVPDLETAWDTGKSSLDNITNDDKPHIISNNLTEGEYASLYMITSANDTSLIAETLVSAVETVTDSTSALVSGIYYFFTIATDSAGNTRQSTADLTVEIDLSLPTCAISFDGDSLVRYEDTNTLATFTFSEVMDNGTVPTVDVNYPEAEATDLVAQTLTKTQDSIWTYSIPLNALGSENMDGVIELTLSATDIAGNAIVSEDITGLNTLRVDNTDPAFSSFSPDTGAYINAIDIFAWTLSEDISSGNISFERISGPGVNVNSDLSLTELSSGVHDPSSLNSVPNLVDGTKYDIIFTSADTAGNTGNDTIASVTYDISPSYADISFTELYASDGFSDTVWVQFNERMNPIPTPTISVDYGGAGATGDDITDADLSMNNTDSTLWYYPAIIPAGTGNQGNVGISIVALDLAGNANDSLSMPDTLYVDNTEATATIAYENITNPNAGNFGAGGDTVHITVSMNEPLATTDPKPTLGVIYGNGNGNVVTGIDSISTTNNDSVWVFEVVIQDSSHNNGPLEISITANDLARNAVGTYVDNNLFRVDNQHPTAFAVGDVIVHGQNPVQLWLNGISDSLEIQVPIETFAQDSTLYFGGTLDVKMNIITQGGGAVSVGTPDSLSQSGSAISFYRSMAEIDAALPSLVLGDSIEVSAVIIDRYGNDTTGTASVQKYVYDPSAPTIGSISGGNVFTLDTLISNDTLSVQWTEFVDPGDVSASGLERYEIAIEKIGTASLNAFYDWDTVTFPTEPLVFDLFLEHNESYVSHIRSFDVAGNISDTLASDTLLRINTAPVITTVDSTVLSEDIAWTDSLSITDPDLLVQQGDAFTYKISTTRILGESETDSVSIDANGVMTWEPTQDDTGSYQIQVIVTDAYTMADTFLFPLTVLAVNDTPIVNILSPDDALSWTEDSGDSVRINLTSYVDDVDNSDTSGVIWQVVIIDTNALDDEYPLGQIVVGPGTSWHTQNKLAREYLGFNPKFGADLPILSNMGGAGLSVLSAANPFISVSLDTINSELWATFTSDSNYFGSENRAVIIAQDLDGAEGRDTITVTVLAENDPPVIATIADSVVWENDSIAIDFGAFTSDVDDSTLTFTISALTNGEFMTITPSTYTSHNVGDSVVFTPQSLWSDSTVIQVIVSDEAISDTATFTLDVLRVVRPSPSVAIIQNNAFSNYLQIVIIDTVEKTTNLSLNIQSESIPLDTIGAFTWIGNYDFSVARSYSFDIFADAMVGDTSWSNYFVLSFAETSERWYGASHDGRFRIVGDPGTVTSNQNFIIVDSSLFSHQFTDKASYMIGDESYQFRNPVEVSFQGQRDDLAIYQRLNGVTWEELPTITKDGQILTFTEKTGYFRTGPRTIIVPEETSLHQNYPNPFNPVTNIVYEVGLLDGLRQNVSISIYNLLGQHVTTLVEKHDQIGQFRVQWNGRDKFGKMLPTGIYFVQLRTEMGIVNNKKMILMK